MVKSERGSGNKISSDGGSTGRRLKEENGWITIGISARNARRTMSIQSIERSRRMMSRAIVLAERRNNPLQILFDLSKKQEANWKQYV